MSEYVVISTKMKTDTFVKMNKFASKKNVPISKIIQIAVDDYLINQEEFWGKIE